MYIVVTDCGYFWNHNNPILKNYKESVVVVCLNGEKATDEYQCFISPYKIGKREIFIGQQSYGPEKEKYQALESVSDNFLRQFGFHENVLFLTDDNPESLYPFLLYIGRNKYNNTHLCAMAPAVYERRQYKKLIVNAMNDHQSLRSLFYLDIAELYSKIGKNKEYSRIEEMLSDNFERFLPLILNGINKMKERSYFDFASMSYIPLTDGFDSVEISEKSDEIKNVDFNISPKHFTLGLAVCAEYPSDAPYDLKRTEQLSARIDGKNVCNILREQRIRLAKANNIPFESEECPSIGPCAGTCGKCDSEAEFLRKELEKIPEKDRIYPQFDVMEEMKNDR